MPLYEFECKSCKQQYEVIAKHDKTGKYPSVSCEHCGSKKKKQLIGLISFSFSNPVGTDRWNNQQTGHDFRYKHNLPNAIKERELAEQKSHVGPSPYEPIAGDENHDLGIFDNEDPIRLEIPD